MTPAKYKRATGSITCNFNKATQILNYKSSSLNKMIKDSCDWLKKESFSKIRWGIRNLLIGSIKMPKGFFFYLSHKSQPIIHRAVTSHTNINDMLMMGIEIKNHPQHNIVINLNKVFYKQNYECKAFSVFCLSMEKGQSTDFQTYNFPGLTIALSETVDINIKNSNSSLSTNTKLKSGEFLWHDANTTQNNSNTSTNPIETIFIALK